MIQTEVMTREQMMSALESKGVYVVGPSEEFQGTKGGIWIIHYSNPKLGE